jgi:hypothetical protein
MLATTLRYDGRLCIVCHRFPSRGSVLKNTLAAHRDSVPQKHTLALSCPDVTKQYCTSCGSTASRGLLCWSLPLKGAFRRPPQYPPVRDEKPHVAHLAPCYPSTSAPGPQRGPAASAVRDKGGRSTGRWPGSPGLHGPHPLPAPLAANRRRRRTRGRTPVCTPGCRGRRCHRWKQSPAGEEDAVRRRCAYLDTGNLGQEQSVLHPVAAILSCGSPACRQPRRSSMMRTQRSMRISRRAVWKCIGRCSLDAWMYVMRPSPEP